MTKYRHTRIDFREFTATDMGTVKRDKIEALAKAGGVVVVVEPDRTVWVHDDLGWGKFGHGNDDHD